MKKKVLMICDASGGGIFEYSFPLYKNLRKKLNINFMSRKEGILNRFVFYKDIIKEILTRKYSTVDIQCLIWPMHLSIILLNKIMKFQLIFEAHEEPWTTHTKYRPMFIRNLIFKNSDKLVAHSRYNKKLLETLGYKDVPYVPIATDLDHLKAYNTRFARKKLRWKDKYYVLFFGWITHNKGLDILLNAIPIVKKEIKGVKFVISGKVFDDWSPYQEIIDSLDLKNSIIRNPNFIPWSEVNLYFSASDLVAMPYRETNNSSVPSVAYYFKKAIVATDDGAFREMILHNKNGLLVKGGNEKELAKAIIKVLKNEKLRKTFGERGYKLLQTTFSWKNITNEYLTEVFV